jgi:diguanylate cyclase (GGDEF)-like protein
MFFKDVRVRLLILFLLSIGGAFQFTLASKYIPPTFVSYSVEDGLSQLTAYDITQDAYGFMWIATQSGIDRFDGYSFRHFGKWQQSQDDGLLNITSYQIEADPDGESLWVGTLGGLSRYAYKKDTFEHFSLIDNQGTEHYVVKRLRIDNNDKLWVLSDNAIFTFDRVSQSLVNVLVRDPEIGLFNDLTVNHEGEVIVSTATGLYQLNQATQKLDLFALSGVPLSTLMVDSYNRLWVGSQNSGVYFFGFDFQNKLSLIRHVTVAAGLADSNIIDLLEARDRSIWITTQNGLSILPDPLADTIVTPDVKKSGLADENLSELYENKDGLIFVGSNSSGFSIYDPDRMKFHTYQIGNSHDTSSLVAFDEDKLWASNESGLWLYNHNTDEVLGSWHLEFDSTHKVTSNRILSIAYDEATKTVWLGTRVGLGRFQLGDENIKIVALKDKPIYSLTVDEDGDVWIGGYNDGVYVYSPQSQLILQHWAMPLTADLRPEANGFSWVANITGLYYLNKHTGSLTKFAHSDTDENSLSYNVVTWISAAKETGYYWVGTQAGGLNRMKVNNLDPIDVEFTPIAVDSKLSVLSIGAVLEDDNNNLWISTTDGIAQYNLVSEEMHYYNSRNGSTDTGYYIGSAAQVGNEKFFFGGKDGLTEFNPDDVAASTLTPKVYITKIDILQPSKASVTTSSYNGKANDFLSSSIELQPENLSFTVEFTALDYSSPKSLQYAYRLRGFDKDWRYVDASRRSATYTNLDPASYVLEVKGTNKDGMWSPYQGYLNVVVVPPWWKQPMAIVLFVIVILTVLFALYRWRVSSLRHRSEELAYLVEKKTIDLENAVAKLTVLSSLDPLTEISNRRDFTARAMVEWDRFERYQQAFSILLVDIDHFKLLNDTYGHEAGDKVLVEVASSLKTFIRRSDILARWGGEEFIVLLPALTAQEAARVADKIRKFIAQLRIDYKTIPLSLTLTIGVVQIKTNESLEDCIHRADINLYKGKEQGRNCVVVSE